LIWALLGLAVAMAGAAATAVVLAVKLGSERAASAKLAAQVDKLTAAAKSFIVDLKREIAAHTDTQTRLENVIAGLKAANKRMEEELAVSLDPNVVRARLARSGLLRPAEEGAGGTTGADPAAGLPGTVAAPVGAGGRGDGGR